MGICWSKFCSHCNSFLVFNQTKTKTYDGMEWNIDYYTCRKCNKKELIYRIPNKGW